MLFRSIWHLLKTQQDGRFSIPEHAIEEPSPEDAIRVDYDPSIKTFTLSAHKVKVPDKVTSSSIIIPNGNLN